ncbi:hypothetical protein VTO73DRAFT_7648 [Trametes versicolor]
MILALPRTIRGWVYFVLSVFIFILGILINLKAHTNASIDQVEWRESDFSYLETDYPPSLFPLSQHPRDAALVIEDTVHYLPNNSREWASLFPAESGGFVRLGPLGRMFGVSMFHQLHCLDKMRRAVVGPPSSEWESWHTQHCINYVRQMLLCASSTRLEPVKVTREGDGEGVKVDGLGLEHQCRDWSLLRRKVEGNLGQWAAGADD